MRFPGPGNEQGGKDMKKQRTFGWIQNPGKLQTLQDVVACFYAGSHFNRVMRESRLPLLLENGFITRADYDAFQKVLSQSPIEVSYQMLKGTAGTSRKDALCDGLIQAAIDGQQQKRLRDGRLIKKPYTQDWSAEGYVRWAVSTGLLSYDGKRDTCCLSPLGTRLVEALEDKDEEAVRQCMMEALLSYPLCIRVLNLLQDEKPHTKYDLGSRIGFQGEMGFTSIPQNIFAATYGLADEAERKKIKANMEGDADKYARMICNWLKQMGLVESLNVTVEERYRDRGFSLQLPAWRVTLSGLQALKRANGYSRYARIPKRVFWEMLATKGADVEYLRCRRAALIGILSRSEKTLDELRQLLTERHIAAPDAAALADDLTGLVRIGLYVQKDSRNKYRINDTIECLETRSYAEEKAGSDVTFLKDRIRTNLERLDHDYLILVDLAYSDKANKAADAMKFEIWTAKLFDELGMNGLHLGGADKPDVLASYGKQGLIVDNKSYQNGFNVDKHCADEMRRYITQNQLRQPHVPGNEWWKQFGPDVTEFYYLFVTSYLTGNFQSNLKELSALNHINGGAISVENLLYLADDLKTGRMTRDAFFERLQNDEVLAPERIKKNA
jgi:hypothetical protein